MMSQNHLPFGEYIKQRREAMGLTMRVFAEKIGISPAYLCDIEKGNRKAPERFLTAFADALGITNPDELNAFYDLAGISKNGQHSDINGYMESVPSARVALRAAKDHNLTNEDWEELIRIIKQKNG